MSFPLTKRLCAFKYLLVLIVAMLSVEMFLTIHATEHGFVEEDGICFSCDKAGKFQYSLISSDQPFVFQQTRIERSELRFQSFHGLFSTGYYPRAPPLFQPL